MNNRYIFFKRLYKDYVVIIQNKSYGVDNKLKDIIKYNNINYVLVDNENNVLVHKVNNNKYWEWYLKCFYGELIEKIYRMLIKMNL